MYRKKWSVVRPLLATFHVANGVTDENAFLFVSSGRRKTDFFSSVSFGCRSSGEVFPFYSLITVINICQFVTLKQRRNGWRLVELKLALDCLIYLILVRRDGIEFGRLDDVCVGISVLVAMQYVTYRPQFHMARYKCLMNIQWIKRFYQMSPQHMPLQPNTNSAFAFSAGALTNRHHRSGVNTSLWSTIQNYVVIRWMQCLLIRTKRRKRNKLFATNYDTALAMPQFMK